MFADAHAHLDDARFDEDREAVIAALGRAGVGLVINAGSSLASSRAAQELADRHGMIYYTAGLHPSELEGAGEEQLQGIMELLAHPKAVAVGEIGLDYHYDTFPRQVQQSWFDRQMDMAVRLGKPVVIHNREAAGDTLDMLRRYKGRVVGQMHCFSGSWETAKACLDMGYFISFAGSLTFKNAARLPEVAARVPEDRLLVETDSPYMTPTPFRGKRNHPGHVRLVAEKLAQLRGWGLEQAAAITLDNACRLFGIQLPQGEASQA